MISSTFKLDFIKLKKMRNLIITVSLETEETVKTPWDPRLFGRVL